MQNKKIFDKAVVTIASPEETSREILREWIDQAIDLSGVPCDLRVVEIRNPPGGKTDA